MGISREAAVAWIVSDSKLVSFTSRHLGTGPTQHDTFVRARCNRVVPPALARPTSTSSSLSLPLSLSPARSPVPPSLPSPPATLPPPGGEAGERETGARHSGGQCTGHAHQPYRDWPDPIHVAMATFLRPSVHQCPCSRSCPFNYPFHVPPLHHRSPIPPPPSPTPSLRPSPVPHHRIRERHRRLSRLSPHPLPSPSLSLSLANREPSETGASRRVRTIDARWGGGMVGKARNGGNGEGMIPSRSTAAVPAAVPYLLLLLLP